MKRREISPMKFLRFLCLLGVLLAAAPGALLAADEVRQKVAEYQSKGYNVPLGIGVGQVWKSGKTVYNLFVEPQWSAASKGAGWPEWQVFVGFNMQFK